MRHLVHVVALLAVSALRADAATILRSADIALVLHDAPGCDVTMTLEVETDGSRTIDHRLLRDERATVNAVALTGTIDRPAVATIGRTWSLPLGFVNAGVHAYTIRYRVDQTGASSDRCPIWLPMTPTDGISRPISIRVQLPPGAQPIGDAFPAMTWTSGGVGTVTLSHVPAFVRTPFASGGTRARAISERRLVDALAVAILITASLAWLARRRWRP